MAADRRSWGIIMIGLVFSLMFMLIRLFVVATVWIIRGTIMVFAMTVQAISSASASRTRR
jgi:hypothetical protein